MPTGPLQIPHKILWPEIAGRKVVPRPRAKKTMHEDGGGSPTNGGRREFSVVQFFKSGDYEYVRRFVTAQEAMTAFTHYTSNVAARVGMTVRVIITDGGDYTKMEWKYGEGITFPRPGQASEDDE